MKYKKYKPDFDFNDTLGLISISTPVQSSNSTTAESQASENALSVLCVQISACGIRAGRQIGFTRKVF